MVASQHYHSDKLIEKVVELRKEFSEYTRIINYETKKKGQLIRALKILHKWAGKPLAIETDTLGKVKLIDGCKIEIESRDGRLMHKSLMNLEYNEMVTIVRAFMEEIKKLAIFRMIERSKENVPRFMLRLISEKGQIPLIFARRYTMEIANNGCDALHLKLFTYIEKLKQYGPFNIEKGGRIRIGMGSRPSNIDSFKIWLYCSDLYGIAYVGKAIVHFERKGWTVVNLKSDRLIS